MNASTPFSIHAAAYWAAREAYEKHREDHCPPFKGVPLGADYDSACAPLVSSMHDAAKAAVRTPAETTAEIFLKVEIFLNEDLHEDDGSVVRELIECIGCDASRIGGDK